jgi:hypothetical protein
MAGNILAINAAYSIYKHTGFSSTVSASFSAVGTSTIGLGWDGSNVLTADSSTDLGHIYKHTGFSTTISSSFSSNYDFPGAITWAGGKLIVISYNAGYTEYVVYKHAGFTTTIQDSFLAPSDSGIQSAGVYSDGDLLVSDTTDYNIFKFTGFSSTITSSISAVEPGPYGVGFDGANLISSYNVSVYKHDGFSTTITASFATTATDDIQDDSWDGGEMPTYSVNSERGAVLTGGTLDTSERGASLVGQESVGSSRGARIIGQSATVVTGNLISMQTTNDLVYRHSGFSTTITSSFSTNTAYARGLAWDGGNVIVSDVDGGNRLIYRHAGFTTTITDWIYPDKNYPLAVAWDGGNLIVLDYNSAETALIIYKHAGFSSTVTSTMATVGSAPYGLAWQGSDLISDDGTNDIIYRHSGFSTTVKDSFSSAGVSVGQLAFDSQNVFEGDNSSARIYRHTGFATTVAANIYMNPWVAGIAWDNYSGNLNVLAQAERSAKLTGKSSTNTARSATLKGGVVSSRGAKLIGKVILSSVRGAVLQGAYYDGGSRGAYLIGKATGIDSRGAKLIGSTTNTRSAKLKGKQSDNSTRGASLLGAFIASSYRGVSINGFFDWDSADMDMSQNIYTIEGVDRSICFLNGRTTIEDVSDDNASSMTAEFFDMDNLGIPAMDSEIVVTKGTATIFAGRLINMTYQRLGSSENILKLSFQDYTTDLNRNLVQENYQNMTDREIIKDLVARYTLGTEIEAADSTVASYVTFGSITFNYMTIGECLNKICDSTNYHWYIDYHKKIHYFPTSENVSDYEITETSAWIKNLELSRDNTNIRNRVYVKGGTYLSDEVTIYQVADGEQTVFYLPEKPSDISVYEGATLKNCGIKNIDTFDDFDYLMSYQEKYVETDVAPAQGTVMSFSYKYYVPIIVVADDTDSVNDFGEFEYVISDSKISTPEDARARAYAEITDYGNTIIDGTFSCYEGGFYAGQYIRVNMSSIGINEDYLVQKVTATSISGGLFIYKITIANAKKLGIIKFLKRLLDNERNILNTDTDEIVDGLYGAAKQDIIVKESLTANDIYSITTSGNYKIGTAKFNLSQFSA